MAAVNRGRGVWQEPGHAGQVSTHVQVSLLVQTGVQHVQDRGTGFRLGAISSVPWGIQEF